MSTEGTREPYGQGVEVVREPDYLSTSSMHHLTCPECDTRLVVNLSASVVISDSEDG